MDLYRRHLLYSLTALAGAITPGHQVCFPLIMGQATQPDNPTLPPGIPADTGAQLQALREQITELWAALSALPVPTDPNLSSGAYLIDPAYPSNSAARRYQTIGEALAVAPAYSMLRIAPGLYTEDVNVTQPGIQLLGAGMPAYDPGTRRLVGGTIVRGCIALAGSVGARVSNLGCDLAGTDKDGLVLGNSGPVDVYQMVSNVALLGSGYGAYAHALLASGLRHLTINNLRMWHWYHGLTLRTSHVQVTNVYAYACTGNSIILKSETPSGDACHINIANVTILGDPSSGYTRGGPIRVQSADDEYWTGLINVANVTAEHAGEAVILVERAWEDGAFRGVVGDLNVTNVWSRSAGDNSIRAEFDVRSGENITLTNCHSLGRVAGYGFRTGYGGDLTSAVWVYASTTDPGGAGMHLGRFDRLELNGQILAG